MSPAIIAQVTPQAEYTFTGGSLSGLTQNGSALTTVADRINGSADAINLGGDNLEGAIVTATDLSVSYWVKTTTNDGNVRTILDQSERVNADNNSSKFKQGWYAYLKNGRIGFAGNYVHGESYPSQNIYISDYTGYQILDGGCNIADGVWHQVVHTADQSITWDLNTSTWVKNYEFRTYIDGVLDAFVNNSRATTAGYINVYAELVPAEPVVIANVKDGLLAGNNRYQDVIDDVRIYNTVISQADIDTLSSENFCTKPRNVQVPNVYSVAAEIEWDTNSTASSWDMAYTESGMTIANGTTVSGINSNNEFISNLSASTSYDVYVRSNCANGIGQTGWSKVVDFTTNEGPVYVNINATGSNDGTSWANAYTSLTTGLAAATATRDVWVAAGTYTPHASDRKNSFTLADGVSVYGGFDGTETIISERDPKSNVTILSGDLSANDNNTITESEATRQDNSYHVVTIRGNAQNVVLDGFTISGGNANGTNSNSCSTAAASQYFDQRGGAIYANPYTAGHNLTAKISNCILENNSGTSVAVYSSFTPCGVQNVITDVDFESCIVRNNYSKDLTNMLFSGSSGYGIYSRGSIINSLFYNNTSGANSSCLYLGTSTANGGGVTGIHVDIINSTFANNTGLNGNVMTMLRSSQSYVKNCIVYGNGSATPFVITTSGSVVSNSIIEGGQQGGTDIDPVFGDALAEDFSLNCSSPGIDAADATGLTLPNEDLAGGARVNGVLDMGAYEFNETINPVVVAETKDITVQLDETGNVSISPEDVDDGSGYGCNETVVLSLDITSFSCSDIGPNTVTLTVDAGANGSETATAVVTVAPPVKASDLTIGLDAQGQAVLVADDVDDGSNAVCSTSYPLSIDVLSFTCAEVGDNMVVLNADAGSGNIGFDTAIVTVQSGVIAKGTDVTVQLDPVSGTYTLDASTIDDGSISNCGAVVTISKSLFTCGEVGNNEVVLIVDDQNGTISRDTVIVNVEHFLTNETVNASDPNLCGQGLSTTVLTGTSFSDIEYSLRDDADDSVLDGPFDGTGAALSFNTGVLNIDKSFNVYATSKGDSVGLTLGDNLDYFGLQKPATLNYSTGYTFEAWVKETVSGASQGHRSIFYAGTLGYGSDVELFIQEGTGNLYVVHNRGNGGTLQGVFTPYTHSGVWCHVAVVYNGSTVSIYLDGVLANSAAIATPLMTPNSSMTFGVLASSAFPWTQTFNGTLDEVRVWETALSANDILNNMNNCLEGNEAGLSVYCSLDDNLLEKVSGATLNMVNEGALTQYDEGAISCGGACGFEIPQTASVTVNVIDLNTTVSGNIITADQSGAVYQWLDCNNGNVEIASETSVSFEAITSGDYSVEIDLNGCVDTSDCESVTLVANKELSVDQVTVSPNPASSTLYLQSDSELKSSTIYDLTGVVVKHKNSNDQTFDISSLPAGVYVLGVVNQKGVSYSRFVKN